MIDDFAWLVVCILAAAAVVFFAGWTMGFASGARFRLNLLRERITGGGK